MCQWLTGTGCSGTHTLDLPARNRTSDRELTAFADQDGAAVATKDSDFVDSHLLQGRPAKLLLISTGNITNDDLEALILPLLNDIVREFQSANFIELNRAGLIVRG